MGIYDREYVRDDAPPRGPADWSAVTWLLVVNGVVFLVDLLAFDGKLARYFGLSTDMLHEPWKCYELLTYGFLHSPRRFTHILFNMFGLWMFGREVERIYGRREMLRIYLMLIVVSGVAWFVVEILLGHTRTAVGASGAISGLVVLFALHHPRAQLLLFGIVPLEAWLAAVLFVALDVVGTINQDDCVAHSAHLAGAIAAFVYFKSGVNLGRLWPSWAARAFRRQPRLRVRDPDADERQMTQEVDRILEKISRSGEASLTRKERRTLEDASRRYQRRRG